MLASQADLFTTVERTLTDAGEHDAVASQRETGRSVQAFLSAVHQDPDILAELFILEPLAVTGVD